MKSKGGKVDYICPICNSPDIYNVGNYYGDCMNCSSHFSWFSRIKISVKKGIYPAIKSQHPIAIFYRKLFNKEIISDY